MKTEQQIKGKLKELNAKMKGVASTMTPEQVRQRDGEYPKLLRLQGNIGALEWVLRKDA